MKEQYIKQVEKELSLPRKMKKEVVRDLNEVLRLLWSMEKQSSRLSSVWGRQKNLQTAPQNSLALITPNRKKERYHFYSCCACYRGCCLFGICCYAIRKSTRRSNRTSRRDNKYTD